MYGSLGRSLAGLGGQPELQGGRCPAAAQPLERQGRGMSPPRSSARPFPGGGGGGGGGGGSGGPAATVSTGQQHKAARACVCVCAPRVLRVRPQQERVVISPLAFSQRLISLATPILVTKPARSDSAM